VNSDDIQEWINQDEAHQLTDNNMVDLMSHADSDHLEDDNEGAGKVDRMGNFFSMAQQPLVGQGLLIVKAS
jgi:hypothetical protein